MSKPHDPPNLVPPPQLPRDPVSQDDMSDVTVNNGRNPEENHQKMTSKVLKFSFVYDKDNKNRAPPSVIHTHWMQIVQDTLGAEIVIINNHNKHVEKVSTIKWSDPAIHMKQFKLYQKTTGKDDNRSTTYYILHRILCNESVGKIKALPSIRKLTKDYRCFISDHQWSETDWDTARIGFVTNIDPSFYNRTQAHHKFNEILHSRQPDTRKIKIPQFRMVFSSPQVRHATHTVSTKAYAIEVIQDNAATMLEALDTLLRGTPTFAATSLRRKFPDGYENAIKFQTHTLQSTMVVILQNISNDMMFYLQPHIMKVNGTRELLATPKPGDPGRYSILVDKVQFESVRTVLRDNLQQWITKHVESDAMPTEFQFSGPARVKPLYDDNSLGGHSWMTVSNASFMSIELPPTADDQHDYAKASMEINRIFTFEDIPADTRPNPTSPPTTNDQDSGKVLKPPAWSTAASDISELEESKKIIEAQRLEIATLKAQFLADKADRQQTNAINQSTREKEIEQGNESQRQETITLREELRLEMKIMMQQFLESFQAQQVGNPMPPPLPSTPESNKSKRRPEDINSSTPEHTNTNTNNNPGSEKRQDDRPTPAKLFTEAMELSDPESDTTVKLADASKGEVDLDL